MEEPDIKYCRRMDETRTPAAPCGRPIKIKNALAWCPECRRRLPFWPADDSPMRYAVIHPESVAGQIEFLEGK